MERKKEEIPGSIGPYVILQSLGRGGMGEVFLAKDPICGRHVALKRIRPELKNNKTIQSRFLREAKVASHLSHPSIVPILEIRAEGAEIYYTMPFVEGETLRQILRQAREEEKLGKKSTSIGHSIPALARIFLSVCEAVAYTHAKGILHRDLKPENIIVGKFGEVMILDWGIADFIDQIQPEEDTPLDLPVPADLTLPGKITGTLAYMAPERLHGKSSSVQTDLYALGVVLYQMLTLQLPFQRKTLAAFRKHSQAEELIDPIEMAPHREIPHQLAELANRSLARSESARYQNVQDLIADLKLYIEGRPEWIALGELDPQRKEDWQFQENILLAKHIAITRSLDVTDWAGLMISLQKFSDNLKIEAEVRLGPKSQGIGFLLSIPEPGEQKHLEEGFCLWLGSKLDPSCKLFRNNVLVAEVKGVFLSPKTHYKIGIEKVDDHLKLFIDGQLKLNFTSHLPLAGSRIGLLHRDGDFALDPFKVMGGSMNAMVNCLAVPNAFLSHKQYDIALEEYRRIGQCFPGRLEGREALFRAGLTLLEQGKAQGDDQLFQLSLKEFEKLHRTPGAPLEYLGKALVYEAMGDEEEEAKCLELGLRKFPKHPLLPVLREHIVYRMHESSLNHRGAAYRIILLSLRHIPDLLDNPDTAELIESLQKNWEPIPFFRKSENRIGSLVIQLAFWLRQIPVLHEMKKTETDPILLENIDYALAELGEREAARLPDNDPRALYVQIQEALEQGNLALLKPSFDKLRHVSLEPKEKIFFDVAHVWNCLLQKHAKGAEAILRKYPTTLLTQETSPLHFPFGAWLYMTKGPKTAKKHFGAVLETPYPPTTVLPSLFLTGKINEKQGWIERAFWWEKKELYRQLELFHKAMGKKNEKTQDPRHENHL